MNPFIPRFLLSSGAALAALLSVHHAFASGTTSGQRGMVTVRPTEIDDVLVNPGIGFMTFQRFNGDALNEGRGWTEGFPIVYQDFDGDLTNEAYPQTSLAYFRVTWRFVEPEQGHYDWAMFDRALATAGERGQQLILRITPHDDKDDRLPPDWYRELTGDPPDDLPSWKWKLDPENPAYLKYFGGLIRELGRRYDGHPNLHAVDISFVSYWGEGAGSHLLTDQTKNDLIDTYLDAFSNTHLLYQPLNGDAPDPGEITRGTRIAASWPDGTRNEHPRLRHVGIRFDCLGDLDMWNDELGDWSHMYDIYPQHIILSGMKDAWKHGPVSLEICGTFRGWLERHDYGEAEVRYIFDQALKWHVSSFNAKSSPVPEEYRPLVDEWLKQMGYRFVLRKFEYPRKVRPDGKLPFKSWWENKGVAPCYDPYPLALRLVGNEHVITLVTDADIRQWMPGDALYDGSVFIPADVPPGEYTLEIAVLDRDRQAPAVKLAIAGRRDNGWYPLSTIEVVDEPGLPLSPLGEFHMP